MALGKRFGTTLTRKGAFEIWKERQSSAPFWTVNLSRLRKVDRRVVLTLESRLQAEKGTRW